MLVVYINKRQEIHLKNFTYGEIYKVLKISQFGNREPDYMIENNTGNQVWVNSVHFTTLEIVRTDKLNQILN